MASGVLGHGYGVFDCVGGIRYFGCWRFVSLRLWGGLPGGKLKNVMIVTQVSTVVFDLGKAEVRGGPEKGENDYG